MPAGNVKLGWQYVVPPGQTHLPEEQDARPFFGQHWLPQTVGLVEGQQNLSVLLVPSVRQMRPWQHFWAAQL